MEFTAKVNAKGKAFVKFEKEEYEGVGNAFIPRVIVNKGKNEKYKIYEDKKKISLSNLLDNDKREINPKIIKLKSKEKIKIKFHIEKGNKNANDSDGGIIKVHYFKKEEKKYSTSHNVAGYNKNIELIFSRDKEITHIKFYADDNDTFFDGGVNNVYCGYFKISNKCQEPLVEEFVNAINLTKEQKAKFMATVLVESTNGNKGLWDIAYVYLNLVGSLGFSKGLKRSSAYREKHYLYKAHLFNLGFGKSYKKNRGSTESRDWDYPTVENYAKTHFSNRKHIQEFKAFCENKIFTSDPKSKYKGWEGQGYYGDMNIRSHREIDKRWAMASQYFHLQDQCKVDKILVVKLHDTIKKPFDSTTYIFDAKKIRQYFKNNSQNLPKYEKGKCKRFNKPSLCNKNEKNAIPGVYFPN